MGDGARFGDLWLDNEVLHTPAGDMPLRDLTRAEFFRDLDKEDAQSFGGGPKPGAVIGGAVVGGMVAGAAGAIGGALVGGAVSDEEPRRTHRDPTVKVIFATRGDIYREWVAPEDEHAAYEFVQAVKSAMKR